MPHPAPRLLACAALLLATLPALSSRAEVTLTAPPTPPEAPHVPAAAPAPAVQPFSDQVVFGDLDAFHGTFKGLSPGGLVTWERRDCAAPFQIKTEGMDFIALSRTAPPAAPASAMLVQLNNGDSLTGTLVEYTPEKIILDTWYAGRIALPTAMARRLMPASGATTPVLDGIGIRADWKIQNGYENYIKFSKDAILFANSGWITRPVAYPKKFKLEFEISGGITNRFYIRLFDTKDGINNNQNSFYNFTFDGNSGSIYRYSRNQGNQSLGQFQANMREGPLTVTLQADADAHAIALLINGKQVALLRDTQLFPDGKYISFLGDNNLKLTNLTLAPWYGQLGQEGAKAAIPTADTLAFLESKDQMSGQVTAIKEGKVTLKTAFGTMEIPLDRVQMMELGAACNKMPAAGKDAVQLFFDETSRLTVQPKEIKNGKITATCDTLGDCTLELAAFKKISFNLSASFRGDAALKAPASAKEGEEAEGAVEVVQ